MNNEKHAHAGYACDGNGMGIIPEKNEMGKKGIRNG